MALLPQDQRQQTMLLVIIVAVAAGGLYFQYLHRPRSEELVLQRERLEDLETQNTLAEARIGNLAELRERLSLAERQFTALEKLVPARAEVPAIYEAIATETQALNLRLISVEPTAPVADSGAYFLRQNWQMRLEGEYHAVGRFLARVASFDRIVRPTVEEITPAGETPGGRQRVAVTFGLETYVLPPARASQEADGAEGDA